ncbi:hypothetical protein ABXV18_24400 [Vibrio owensii]|uniref:hypothetical protein n=1 Tax=Vibrio owensii TaxID=696485 RepID=UPI00339993AC
MSHKPYSRSEIVKRSRDRHKILKEEAEKVGIAKTSLWISETQRNAIEEVSDNDLDSFINIAINERLKKLGRTVCDGFPLDEVKMRAFIRQKQLGL